MKFYLEVTEEEFFAIRKTLYRNGVPYSTVGNLERTDIVVPAQSRSGFYLFQLLAYMMDGGPDG